MLIGDFLGKDAITSSPIAFLVSSQSLENSFSHSGGVSRPLLSRFCRTSDFSLAAFTYFSLLGATLISDSDTVIPATVEYSKPKSLMLSRISLEPFVWYLLNTSAITLERSFFLNSGAIFLSLITCLISEPTSVKYESGTAFKVSGVT